MKDFNYLIENFFTHKDYLVPAEQMPGTLFTPLHFLFSLLIFSIVASSSIYVSKRKEMIKPVFVGTWMFLLVFEVIIVTWESLAGKVVGLDLVTNLSLYPCSIYLYIMPFAIWGKGMIKRMACGYVCTLGFLGGAVNFLYPATRLVNYSCISFPGFHTFVYHGILLFTCFVMVRSNYHTYTNVTHRKELFLPCVPSLLMSIPANIVNYSPIDADYMFFRGKLPLLAAIFSDTPEIVITLILYILYIFVPASFYFPSYLSNVRKRENDMENIVNV